MLLKQYQNGNADIKLYDDGTRIIECVDDQLKLNFPLNIDIRISEACAFGLNPTTGKAICDFCHESATTNGNNACLFALRGVLGELPPGIELAIGLNQITNNVVDFLEWCKWRGLAVNCTINQGHLRRDRVMLQSALHYNLINGLGVSYRKGMIFPSDDILEYPNTVVHVIAGIDLIEDVKSLANQGVKKILVLGEKNFGFNLGKVRIVSDSHRAWYRQLHELFKLFDVVSFDNLALEQLNVRRFVKDWDTTYQHEYSFYINAVQRYFAPSSRSADVTWYDKETAVSITQYFKSIFPES